MSPSSLHVHVWTSIVSLSTLLLYCHCARSLHNRQSALRTINSFCAVHNMFCATSDFPAVFFDNSQNNLQFRGAINYQYTMCTIHNTQSIDLYESPHENDATTTSLSSLIHTFELIDLVFQRNRDLFCAKRVYDKTKRARQVCELDL